MRDRQPEPFGDLGAPAEPVRPLRLDETLLAALEQAVAGASRAETAERLGLPVVDDALDAVYGEGSPPDARLVSG